MSYSLRLIYAIARADVLFRFRKTTTIVLLLAVAGIMYLFVPDYRTGNTLMQIEGHRVIYSSATIALGTAVLCSSLLSIVGYYLVSNSLKRDILSRVGYIIAATPVTDLQYVLGKFFGNLAYLIGVMLACMVSAMIMFLIRGEGMLNPLIFLEVYSWAIVPGLAFASAAAIAFESLPKLSGRMGDVLFFLLWGGSIGVPAAIREENGDIPWLQGVDIVGIVQLINQMDKQLHTKSLSFGYSNYDVAKTPMHFNGLEWTLSDLGFRLMTFLIPLLFVLLAWWWFHRFNPVRIKSVVRHSKLSLLGRLNNLLKPVTLLVTALFSVGANRNKGVNLVSAVKSDMLATLALSPLTPVAIVIFAVLSLVLDPTAIRAGLLPAMVVALVIALADIATRDTSSGMMSLLFTAPKIKQTYVWWKLASALGITFCFTLIPIVRLAFSAPVSAVSLLIGSFFMASGAVGLGVLSKSRKAFMGIFLMLLYIALNSSNDPTFDFAGFYALATPGIQFIYAMIGALMLAITQLRYTQLIKR